MLSTVELPLRNHSQCTDKPLLNKDWLLRRGSSGFRYFQGTIALQRKKLTECMSKMMSLCDNVTNLYAKCRMWNEKKNMTLFQLLLHYSLLNLPSTIKLPKIPKITKKCSDCNIQGLWLKLLPRMTSICISLVPCCRSYDIFFFIVLNLSFCSLTSLFSSMKLRPPKSNKSRSS